MYLPERRPRDCVPSAFMIKGLESAGVRSPVTLWAFAGSHLFHTFYAFLQLFNRS